MWSYRVTPRPYETMPAAAASMELFWVLWPHRGRGRRQHRRAGHRLTIAANGRVRANVTARKIEVHGCFAGQAEATERIRLSRGAEFLGDIWAASIVIEEGAFIKGKVELSRFRSVWASALRLTLNVGVGSRAAPRHPCTVRRFLQLKRASRAIYAVAAAALKLITAMASSVNVSKTEFNFVIWRRS